MTKPAEKPGKDQSDSAAVLMHESKKGKKKICCSVLCTGKPIVLDSGATHHLVNNPDVYLPTTKTSIKILKGGHKNFLYATAVGTATLINHLGNRIRLDNALLVPTLNRSLISIPRVFKNEFSITKSGDKTVTTTIDNKFKLLAINPVSSYYMSSGEMPNWHARLGHPNPNICKECKLKALSFSGEFKADQVLAAVHMDLVGPFPVQSHSKFVYFLTLIDQFSGFWTVKFLKIVNARNVKCEEFNFPGLKEELTYADQTHTSGLDPLTLIDSTPENAQETNSVEPILEQQTTKEVPKAPKEILSQISTDNILSVDRRGNSVIVHLVEKAEDNTPAL
ncbi:uncharacterized protein VP01_3882g1 [Puccinia sorghi]|uniref:Retrovirus-related Pol polyprotein from transposon TNT 1-94-like beta-barrel domain-containing protein n=1 Tax=Puccinia sorghi TaxID=27349 RepID=A0A0L6USZ0_9BASI|nr:uncharacterized protein VP01_3882g1 [Puccinia sorghi]